MKTLSFRRFQVPSITALCAVSFVSLSIFARLSSADDIQNRVLVGEKSTIKTDEPESDAKWEKEWTKLCSYDEFCHRLKDPKDSSWINPETVQETIMKYYRNDIIKASKLYGIDPRALVGSFLADLTIIPIYDADAHKFLVEKALGRNPTAKFPLGLVYSVAALPVERLAAKIEGRPVRSKKKVEELINTPVGTIYYGAAVIRDAQDRYKAHGFDISKRPDILATLYNLGKVEPKAAGLEDRIKRAKAMRAKGATDLDMADAGLTPDVLAPRPNFFGLFTNKNAAMIDSILDPNEAVVPVNPAQAGPCMANRTAALAEYNLAKALQKDYKGPDAEKVTAFQNELEKKLDPNKSTLKDFQKAYAQVSASNSLCPAGSKTALNNVGDPYCVYNHQLGTAPSQSAFVAHFEPPVVSDRSAGGDGKVALDGSTESSDDDSRPALAPAQVEICYYEASNLGNDSAAQFKTCFSHDIGDSKVPTVTTDARRYSGRSGFTGQESMRIPDTAEGYVELALPLTCYYPPKSSMTAAAAPDTRVEQRTGAKAQSSGSTPAASSSTSGESKANTAQ